MFIVLGMIVLVAAFNVVSSLIMLVKDKRRDIAVLRTLGASSGAVRRIFVMCGAFVGVSGTLIGTLIGIVFCRNIVAIQHAVEDITGGQVFDAVSVPTDGLAQYDRLGRRDPGGGAGTGAVVAGYGYPSWRAARTDPVEALRHE